MNIELLAGLLFKTGKYATLDQARAAALEQSQAEPTLIKRFEPGRPIGGGDAGK